MTSETERGMDVMTSGLLRDGQLMIAFDGTEASPVLLVGTRPLTDVEMAGEEGRYIVRRGLADVLEWLDAEVERVGRDLPESELPALREAIRQTTAYRVVGLSFAEEDST